MSDLLRSWFDPSRYAADLDRVRRFWAGEGRFLISVNTAEHPYRQQLHKPGMLEEIVSNLRVQATLPGVNIPSIYPDYGTVSTARHWGGRSRIDPISQMIYIDPVAPTLDEALAIQPLPVDHPDLDAARALALWREISRRLETDALWLRSPDMQGTLNTAGLVVNQEELLMAMYHEPDKVHAFLQRVCDLLIQSALYLRRGSGDRVCGNIWPYTFLPSDLGISLTEDLMPLLAADTYAQFGLPYLQQIDRAMGGVAIHCCGVWGRHVPTLTKAGLRLRSAEFHFPCTSIEELEPLADSTVFVPYVLLNQTDRFKSTSEYWSWLIEKTPQRFRYWFPIVGESEEMLCFAREYGDGRAT